MDEKSVDLRPSTQVKDPATLWEEPPEKGEGVPIAARVSPTTGYFIQEVIQSGTFRFKSQNDFVRTAVAFFLRDYIAPFYRDGRFDEGLKVMAHINRAALVTRDAADVERYFRHLAEAVFVAGKNHQYSKAKELMRTTLTALAEAKDAEWAQEVRRRINENPTMVGLKHQVEQEDGVRE